MSEPIIFVVDDDQQVLAAIRRDLKSRYQSDYRVLAAASGESALETIRELKVRGDAIAMLITDQRLPGMVGVDLLARCRELYPLTKRVLLTAYSDIKAAIRAINEIRLDKNEVEGMAQQLFGCGVKQLDKMQASQLIEELFENVGRPQQRSRWRGQPQRQAQ